MAGPGAVDGHSLVFFRASSTGYGLASYNHKKVQMFVVPCVDTALLLRDSPGRML